MRCFARTARTARRLVTLSLPALLAVVAACESTEKDLYGETLGLTGVVTGPGGTLPDVVVIGRCGSTEVRGQTGADGLYGLALPRTGCDRVVVTWEKESFSRNIRTFRLPLPRASVTLDVRLAELDELICGKETCSTESGTSTDAATPGVLARGWVGGISGQSNLAAMPGEFFDPAGQTLLMLGVSEGDYRDQTGAPILDPGGQEGVLCFPIEADSYDELQDTAEGNDTIDFVTYEITPATGQWTPIGSGFVSAGGFDSTGQFHQVAYRADELGDIRRGDPPVKEIALGPEPAPGAEDEREKVQLITPHLCRGAIKSGIFGLGFPLKGKGCVQVRVTDPCGRPEPETTVALSGRDRSFYNWLPAGADGTACLETPRSEATGEALSLNGVDGETFWVDLSVIAGTATLEVGAVAVPAAEASCAKPESCTVVDLVRPAVANETCEAETGGATAPPTAAPTDDGSTDGEGPANGDGPIVIEGK
ncbi:hypothetical protein L6V77_06190 [Myxococcota bacterium]|nr:hypothetical protein [Myxococcota bacterium]